MEYSPISASYIIKPPCIEPDWKSQFRMLTPSKDVNLTSPSCVLSALLRNFTLLFSTVFSKCIFGRRPVLIIEPCMHEELPVNTTSIKYKMPLSDTSTIGLAQESESPFACETMKCAIFRLLSVSTLKAELTGRQISQF